ncbi:hypothetical protein D1007_03920 [Hordeum vulgare]|nr:hypothetical protein D1007_03920 [Hordeum vulgare]
MSETCQPVVVVHDNTIALRSSSNVRAEFALVRIDQPLLDNEELVREVSDCKTIGEAFSSGYLIAWPSAFIGEKND